MYIPSDLLVALGDAEGTWWSDPELQPVICDAIRAWIARPTQAQAQQEVAATGAGLQWKQLFLPDGTRLRATFGKESWQAVVQDGQLRYGEHIVSPSCFANLHGSGNRNAWKAVWLRFPDNEQWFLADTCRAKQKEAIARLFAGAAVATAEEASGPKTSPQPRMPQPASPPESAQRTSAHPDTPPGTGKNKRKNRRGRRKWQAKTKAAGAPQSAKAAAPS